MDILFHPSGSLTVLDERGEPTHGLSFSCGSPMSPIQLRDRQQKYLPLTVKTRLFESPTPETHYWFSRDMEWWSSAAKQVLDDIHLLLTRHCSADMSRLYTVSLCGPWNCGPWKSDATWLSRFIHRYCADEGTTLYTFRNKVDKHLKDKPDTLRFDVFLLQCWSEMALSAQQQRTFETIYELNDEAPEVSMNIILAFTENSGRANQAQQPGVSEPSSHLSHTSPNDPHISYPAAHLDQWAILQPELAREHEMMFQEYAHHLIAEYELEFETYPVPNPDSPPEIMENHIRECILAQIDKLVSYINCVITLAQQDLEMVTDPGLSSGSSSVAESLSLDPVTPPDGINVSNIDFHIFDD
ncbi:hypothetical protein diail_5682 [Diaporthe ilicicola]|nr:hypothetical protein diail_5682 [Diaporthe ilicicola]